MKLNLNIQYGAIKHVYKRGMLSTRPCFHGVRNICKGSSGVCLRCRVSEPYITHFRGARNESLQTRMHIVKKWQNINVQ